MSAGVESPIFVGRQAEMAVLAALTRRALAGESVFALIGGEAGVGKTRLAGELVRQASGAGFTALIGHCIELGAEGLPLAPLVDALRTLARSTPPDELAGLLGPGGRGLARLLPELAADATAQLSADGISPAQLLELVLGLLGRLSARSPVLLILEDLHWADRSTLELAAFLVRSLRGVRVMLVCTYRSDELHRRHPLRPLLTSWERVRSVGRVELRRFDRHEVAAQLAAILASEPEPGLVDLIFDRSGGNAYLVEELTGVMRDGGDPADLPPSLRDVLLSRADSLSADAQRLLRTASVGGRRVPDRLLAQVAGIGETELFAGLREVVESHLLVVDASGHGYEFRHALTRDAIYEDMLPGERVRLHAAYGAALDGDPRLAGDSGGPAALAHHWYAALDLPRAVSASVTAATHAMTSFAPAEAQRHLERALEMWPMVPDAEQRTGIDQAEVTHLAGHAAYLAGDVDRALSLLDQALADLSRDTDATRRALLIDRRATVLRDVGREAEAIAALRQALAMLPAEPVSLAHATVLGSLAVALMRASEVDSALDMAERAVRAARAVGAIQEEAGASVTLGLARCYLGHDGIEDLRAGLALALRLDVPSLALRGYVNLSDVLEMTSRHQEAADVAAEGVALATSVGMARQLGSYLTGNLVEPLLRLGRWEQADQLSAQALSTQPEGVFAATLLQLRAEQAALSGRYADADAQLRAARLALGETADVQFVQTVLYADALTAHGKGDLAGAREKVASALAGVEPSTMRQSLSIRYAWPLLWLGMRIEADLATLARDRRERLPELTDDRQHELARIAAELTAGTPSTRGYLALMLAEQARLGGHADEQTWSRALAAWRQAGDVYMQAYTLLRLAETQCTQGGRHAAAGNVRLAHAIASQIGAEPIAAESAALARRAGFPLQDAAGSAQGARGARAPSAVPSNDELARFGLTVREREILLLLAAGRSNPQIAQELFISPKTASVHVSNILAKLGVSGRIEAAAVAHRLGMTDPAA